MGLQDLADLIRDQGEQSRRRDEQIVAEVAKIRTDIALHSHRLATVEARCQRQSAQAAESRRHWSRWIIITIVGLGVSIAATAIASGLGGCI